MNLSHRWTAAVVVGVAVLSAPGVAQAQSVTNPAEHPFPISVTIDGQTYTDGKDTLPGYDDIACTAIPYVSYDFDSNAILYYDSDGQLLKTAKWSEWSRISTYEQWLKDQKGTPTPTATAAPTQTATTTPAPTSTGTTTQTQSQTSTQSQGAAQTQTSNPSTKTQTTKSTTTKSTTKTPTTKTQTTKSSSGNSKSTTNSSSSTTKSSTSTSTSTGSSTTSGSSSSTSGGTTSSTPKGSTTAAASSAGTTTAGSDPAATTADAPVTGGDGGAVTPTDAVATTVAGAEPAAANNTPVVDPNGGTEQVAGNGGPGAVIAAADTTKYALASETVGSVGDTRLAGIGILIALVALGFFCLAFGEVRQQLFGRRRP